MTENKLIRVMTVDDHEIMRGGIKFLLLAFEDLELVGEASSGQEAVSMCQEVRPDVVLMDMKMSGMDGVATTAAVKSAVPETNVLVLTSFLDRKLVQTALQAGAVGYVLKDTSKDDLAEAIRAAHAGQTTLSPEVTKALVEAEETAADLKLTPCEMQVLRHLVRGLSNKQIGEQLDRSFSTVRQHVSHLMRKMGAVNRAEAAAIAVRLGLVQDGGVEED